MNHLSVIVCRRLNSLRRYDLKNLIYRFLGVFNDLPSIVMLSYSVHCKTLKSYNSDEFLIYLSSRLPFKPFKSKHLDVITDPKQISDFNSNLAYIHVGGQGEPLQLSLLESKLRIKALDALIAYYKERHLSKPATRTVKRSSKSVNDKMMKNGDKTRLEPTTNMRYNVKSS